MRKLYQIMHKELPVCEINLKNGSVTIFHEHFLPMTQSMVLIA